MHIRHGILTAALAGLALLPAAATAAPPKPPTPAQCATAADPAGDAFVGFAGQSTPVPADGNQDIAGISFTRHVSADGDDYVLARLSVPNLTQTAPMGSLGVTYRLFYTDDAAVEHYFDTSVSTLFGGPSFSYGHFDTTQGGLVGDGDGSGTFQDGPDGYIELRLPGDIDPASDLAAVRWNAATDEGAVIAQSDVVPDTGELSFAGSRCAIVVDPPVDEDEE